MIILSIILSIVLGMSHVSEAKNLGRQFKNTYDSQFYSRSYDIPNYILNNMYGKSTEEGNSIIDKLSVIDVSYWDFNGEINVGMLIVNKSVEEELQIIFMEVFLSNFKIYQIKPVYHFDGNDELSMKNNNTSAFNYRYIKGTQKLSNHSHGLAIDINPVQNPYISNNKIYPEEGRGYTNRLEYFDGGIYSGDKIVEIFKKYGWVWGGDWKNSKDYQHFEKKE